MRTLRNAWTLLTHPRMCSEYLQYQFSRARHGEAVRVMYGSLSIGGFSGFGEFHSVRDFLGAGERRFLREYPLGDGPIIDVGANLGLFSLFLAERYPERTIHAFEPNPTTYTALQGNFARNHCRQAHAHAQAVAARQGEILFQADRTNRATTHLISDEAAELANEEKTPVVQVPCTTLDDFAVRHQLGEIALLKVDVEGYETLVFQGAERLLQARKISMIYYEVCPPLSIQAGFRPEAASEQLLASGYQIYRLDDQGQLRAAGLEQINETSLSNWVAIRPGEVQVEPR
jgi:FkbM family methyltransferase